ncbi:MAG: hypothetical protein JXB19_11415 [Bacteroidales bacterium]|nr:hypothetical protein [Bacteroidales bacterium]
MPYRRLPNTDLARFRALRIAYEKGKELPPFKLAFSQETLQRLNSSLPGFEKILLECRQAFNKQVNSSKEYKKSLQKVKLYMSHFIQVVNMAIARGDLRSTDREYFGFSHDQKKVPAFQTETSVIKWGEKLIQGESRRLMNGLTPVSNPTIALVKVKYETFLETYIFQKMLQKNLQRCQTKLSELRITADDIIVTIWNEVEDYYKDLPEEHKRNNSRIYGVVYFYRRNELRKKNENPALPV